MPRQKNGNVVKPAEDAHSVDTPSRKPAVFLQQGNYISDSLGVGLVGFELVAELHKIAMSLALSSASRSFSLLSCFIRCSTPASRRQLSNCCAEAFGYDNHNRHRGNDEPHAPLLLELEADACWEGDVVIGAEQGDQGNHVPAWAWMTPWRSNQG